jgi:serine/threonine-protein kinase HipA
LKNGDAHLKNFGVLYEDCAADAQISLAPTYDIITTSVYIKADSMALLLGGSKAWPKYKMLMRFGRSACNLTEGRCNELLQQVGHGMEVAMDEMVQHIKANGSFARIGAQMLEQWQAGIARSLVKN